jgi:hypothetical protein
MVQAGSLDDPDRISPQAVIYLKYAVCWDRFGPDLPKYEGMCPFDERTQAAMRNEFTKGW